MRTTKEIQAEYLHVSAMYGDCKFKSAVYLQRMRELDQEFKYASNVACSEGKGGSGPTSDAEATGSGGASGRRDGTEDVATGEVPTHGSPVACRDTGEGAR